MGQAITRQIAARLNQASQRQESKMMRELLDEAAQKKNRGDKYTDPNATVYGFQRDTAGLQKEVDQAAWIKKQLNPTMTEMPPDLIEFLKAAGPIRKLEDPTMEGSVTPETVRATESRRQRRMPLRQDLNDDWDSADKDPSMTVSRSTHFSTKTHDVPDDQMLMTDTEIFHVLTQFAKQQDHTHRQGENHFDHFIESQLNQYWTSKLLTDSTHAQIIRKRNHDLLQNTLHFTTIPILTYMDDTWVGYHPSSEYNKNPMNQATGYEAQWRLEWEITNTKK
jgi:hypothetical protein